MSNNKSVSPRERAELAVARIKKAYHKYLAINAGKPPSAYRLAKDSGQSKYYCAQFLSKSVKNINQANSNRRKEACLRLQIACDAYFKKFHVQPSTRELAIMAKASHRTAQEYLLTGSVKTTIGKQAEIAGTFKGKPNLKTKSLPAISPKLTKPYAGFGKLTKARKARLDEAYDWFKKKKARAVLARKDVGVISSRAEVEYWIAEYYFDQLGLLGK